MAHWGLSRQKKNIVCKGETLFGHIHYADGAVIRSSGPGLRLCVLWKERIESLQVFFAKTYLVQVSIIMQIN